MTPLMVVAANGNAQGLDLLLQHGAGGADGLLRRGKHAEGFKRKAQGAAAATISLDEWASYNMSKRYLGR
eukprot:COSAG01_NODE_1032_length_12010_cov_10.208494_4_plen_70_part_00